MAGAPLKEEESGVKLQPAVRHRSLEQDGHSCRKGRMVVPLLLMPTHETRGDDRVHAFDRGAEQLSGQQFGPGPKREQIGGAAADLSPVFLLVPYLN